MLVTLRVVSSRLDHNTELSTSDFVTKSQEAIQDLLAFIVDLDADIVILEAMRIGIILCFIFLFFLLLLFYSDWILRATTSRYDRRQLEIIVIAAKLIKQVLEGIFVLLLCL